MSQTLHTRSRLSFICAELPWNVLRDLSLVSLPAVTKAAEQHLPLLLQAINAAQALCLEAPPSRAKHTPAAGDADKSNNDPDAGLIEVRLLHVSDTVQQGMCQPDLCEPWCLPPICLSQYCTKRSEGQQHAWNQSQCHCNATDGLVPHLHSVL